MSEHSVPEDTRTSSPGGGLRHEQEEALQRFNDASRAFFLLAERDVPEERLERVGRTMDSWARRLA